MTPSITIGLAIEVNDIGSYYSVIERTGNLSTVYRRLSHTLKMLTGWILLRYLTAGGE